MKSDEIIKLAERLSDSMGPDLRQMIYIEWFGWLGLIAAMTIAGCLSWRFRSRMMELCDDMPIGHFAAVLLWAFASGLLVAFIPYTAKVITVPELEALRSLVNG